jgi:putative colanic acid biosynthesis acetyltransferase WcaF
MSKVKLETFSNPNYNHGKSILIRLIWIIVSRLFIDTTLPYPNSFKCFVLRIFGGKIGTNINLKPKIKIKHPWFLEIGNHTWIGEEVWIDNLVKVKIGDNVCISQGAFLLTGNHNYKESSFDLITGEIILEEGVWIGAKSTVCPGIHCFSHSILSVGSVATKNLDSYGIYQGNPAVYKKERIINNID